MQFKCHLKMSEGEFPSLECPFLVATAELQSQTGASVFQAATVFPWFSGPDKIVRQVAVKSHLSIFQGMTNTCHDASGHGLFAEGRPLPGFYTNKMILSVAVLTPFAPEANRPWNIIKSKKRTSTDHAFRQRQACNWSGCHLSTKYYKGDGVSVKQCFQWR